MSEKKTALLIDDNEATATLITAILKKDFELAYAMDGMEALEQLRTRRHDVILLDLRMPKIDGFGVLDHLMKDDPPAVRRTIIVTAALSAREVRQASSYPVFGVLRKPFEIDELLALVRRCAGGHDRTFNGVFSSGPVFLLIAELLGRRWL